MNRYVEESSTDSLDLLESSSDDELLEALYPPRKRRIQNYVEEIVPGYTNKQFLEHFRVSRRLAVQLSERFEASADFRENATGGHDKLSALKYILVFLWFAGHKTTAFRDVSNRFNIALSTLHHVIKIVTLFISGLSPEVVLWPGPEEQVDIEAYFAGQGFPGAIGAIDGNQIKIDRPAEDQESYLNPKQYHSIQLQAVCDHRGRIRDLFTGYPGSVHDARIFRNSPLWESIQDSCREGFFVLGDTAYPCLPHVLTPFKDSGTLTERERNFNIKHSSNRYVIEQCFGVMKQKFRQLYHIKLQSIETIVHFIRACCVLHNLQLEDDPTFPPGGDDEKIDNPQFDHVDGSIEDVDYDDYERVADNVNGIQLRNNIAERLDIAR